MSFSHMAMGSVLHVYVWECMNVNIHVYVCM